LVDQVPDIACTSWEDVAASLQTNTQVGLTPQEAQRRLLADGPNALTSEPAQAHWRRALAQFQDPLVYLLLAAIGIALAAWWMEGRVGWPVGPTWRGLFEWPGFPRSARLAQRGARLYATSQS
jgi:Ca2+-transporting ATPase